MVEYAKVSDLQNIAISSRSPHTGCSYRPLRGIYKFGGVMPKTIAKDLKTGDAIILKGKKYLIDYARRHHDYVTGFDGRLQYRDIVSLKLPGEDDEKHFHPHTPIERG